MQPSWPGLLLILAFPNSVSTIAPLVKMFRLTKCGLAAFSSTFRILVLVDLPFLSTRFTESVERSLLFVFPPQTRILFDLMVSEIFVLAGNLFNSFFRLDLSEELYRPPVNFLFALRILVAIWCFGKSLTFKAFGNLVLKL